MKLSVVIPAYNEEKVIGATISAVLAQDYPDFEIIVVNNASTDATERVARTYPVKVVTEPKKGLLSARERGRIEAVGDIIVNIDADCLPEKDWLSRGASLFSDEKVVAVSGPYDYFDGGVIFRTVSLFVQKNIYWMVSKIVQLPFIKHGAIIIGGNNFIRAQVLTQTQGYNTSIAFYGEDTNTARRVARFGYVIFCRSLLMKTSARRFIEEGKINITIKYLFHFFYMLFKSNRNI